MRSPITLVVGRFEDLIARGLRSLLAEDPTVEVVAADVELSALDAVITEHEPAVALINVAALPSPAEVNRLRTAHPQTRVLVLADRDQALAFGATPCLSKELPAGDLLDAVRRAAAADSDELGPELLTPREADVLEHLRAGRSNAEIALALAVSVETIRTHRRNIYRKLGVRTRRELASLTP